MIDHPAQLRKLDNRALGNLAAEMRHVIKTTVSANGGHLASNLGLVELTIALHRVFDFYQDRLVLDVGHQCYGHKLLTGRAGRFATLRQENGISGFPSPAESDADPFYVGHAGTAVASAVGLAMGAQLAKSDEHVVALVGDASIVNGVSFEGLNNLALIKRQMLIILNDNSMAISRSEGAFANYLTRLRVSHSYEALQRRTRAMVRRLPYIGRAVQDALDRITDGIKSTVISGGGMFEQLGIPYFGPVDGHDIASLIKLLEAFKHIDHPVLLHVHTEKGRGFTPASDDPQTFHSPRPFTIDDTTTVSFPHAIGTSFTSAFASALIGQMDRDEKVVAITAAMPDGTGLARVAQAHPDRVLDVGISESAAVDIAAGLAKKGFKPVVAIYSTFLQRGFDQVFQEVSLQNLPVIFCMDRAGLVGEDGAVHHGFCDMAILRTLPHVVVMAPMDQDELNAALAWAVESGKPCAIRYPRAVVPDKRTLPGDYDCKPFELGKAAVLRGGADVMILACGAPCYDATLAAETLAADGIHAGVVSMRFAKPLDTDTIRRIWEAPGDMGVLTVEDHALAGGFGSAVLEAVNAMGLDGTHD